MSGTPNLRFVFTDPEVHIKSKVFEILGDRQNDPKAAEVEVKNSPDG